MFQAILPKLSISCTLLCTQNLGTVLTQVSNMRKPISTDKSIIALKPEDKEYLVSVKGHQRLYLRVRENGSKSWSYRYNCPISKKAEKSGATGASGAKSMQNRHTQHIIQAPEDHHLHGSPGIYQPLEYFFE